MKPKHAWDNNMLAFHIYVGPKASLSFGTSFYQIKLSTWEIMHSSYNMGDFLFKSQVENPLLCKFVD